MTEPTPEHSGDVTRGEFSHLQGMVQSILDRLPLTQQQAQQHTEHRLERPSTVEDQVAAALRQRDAEEQAKTERTEAKAHREATDGRLAKLEEAPPAEAASWRSKMWS